MRTKLKYPAAALLLVALSGSPAAAQIEVGLIGGSNYSTYHADTHGAEHSRELGFAVGGILERAFTPILGLRTGAIYIQKAGSAADAAVREDVTLSASMVEVPLFLTVGTGETTRPYLLAGPTVAFVLSSDLEGSDSGISFIGDMTDVTNRWEVGLGIGGGLSHRFRRMTGFVEGRYVWGLNNLMKGGELEISTPDGAYSTTITADEAYDEYQYSGLQVLLGFTVPIGGGEG